MARLNKGSSYELLADVEKTLQIFQAMESMPVARRCTDLTQEIFEVAKMALQETDIRNDRAPMSQENVTFDLMREFPDDATHEKARDDQTQKPLPLFANWGSNALSAMATRIPNEDLFTGITDVDMLDSFGASLFGLDMDDCFYGDLESGLNGDFPT